MSRYIANYNIVLAIAITGAFLVILLFASNDSLPYFLLPAQMPRSTILTLPDVDVVQERIVSPPPFAQLINKGESGTSSDILDASIQSIDWDGDKVENLQITRMTPTDIDVKMNVQLNPNDIRKADLCLGVPPEYNPWLHGAGRNYFWLPIQPRDLCIPVDRGNGSYAMSIPYRSMNLKPADHYISLNRWIGPRTRGNFFLAMPGGGQNISWVWLMMPGTQDSIWSVETFCPRRLCSFARFIAILQCNNFDHRKVWICLSKDNQKCMPGGIDDFPSPACEYHIWNGTRLEVLVDYRHLTEGMTYYILMMRGDFSNEVKSASAPCLFRDPGSLGRACHPPGWNGEPLFPEPP